MKVTSFMNRVSGGLACGWMASRRARSNWMVRSLATSYASHARAATSTSKSARSPRVRVAIMSALKRGLARRDAQPHVIDGPDAVVVKLRAQCAFDFGDALFAQETGREHFEPVAQSRFSCDRSWTWKENGRYWFEAATLQQRRVLPDAGVIPGMCSYGFSDAARIATAAEFGHRPPARFESGSQRFGGGLRWPHPMQDRVREHRVKEFL